MDFEDQEVEEREGEEAEFGPSYEERNSTQPTSNKLPGPIEEAAAAAGSPRKPKYRECLKNHALGVGGQAVDGCGEFIAAGPEGTVENLKCAACSCHRSFHRKENGPGGVFPFYPHNHHYQQQQQLLLTHHPHVSYRAPHVIQQRPPAPLALTLSSGGGAAGSGSREDLEDYYSNPSSSSGKKRFRTKFTQEQKDKMLSFAERLDWKFQKHDEELVQHFLNASNM